MRNRRGNLTNVALFAFLAALAWSAVRPTPYHQERGTQLTVTANR